MKRTYLIANQEGPVTTAMTQASAMNALFDQAAKHLISFPDERPFSADLREDSDHNLKLTLTVTGARTVIWTATTISVYTNDHRDPKLTAEAAIQHYVEFLES